MEKIAIIDLGSNSIRMIIMKINKDHSYRMLEEVKMVVRLSEGMNESLDISEIAIQRTIQALIFFRKTLNVYEVDQVRAVATAAVRMARNREEVLRRFYEEGSFQFSVLSGEEEAYYGFLGVINTMDKAGFLLLDIGGGSVELSQVGNRKILHTASIPLGAVRVTELYGLNGPLSKTQQKTIQNELQGEIKKIKFLQNIKNMPIIALGGTNRTLGKIHMVKTNYPLQTLHGYRMDEDALSDTVDFILEADREDILKIEGISSKRAEVIRGGFLVIKAILETVSFSDFIISAKGVREGLFYEHYLRLIGMGAEWQHHVAENSILNLIKNYDLSPVHVEKVWHFAKTLFDCLKESVGFSKEEEKLLCYASYAHDLGMSIDYYNHHQHSFYMVLNANINGMSHEELICVAFISGMHRTDKRLKENPQKYEGLLDRAKYEMCKKLAVLLMIAEKLDRSESGKVDFIRCRLCAKEIYVKIESRYNLSLEMDSLKDTQKYFKRAFGKKIIFE